MIYLLKQLQSFCYKGLVLFFAFVLLTGVVYAQLPNDLRSVKVDELSDDEIRGYIKQSEATGIPQSEQEKIALQKGFPPAELQKLKDRVEKIKAASKPTQNETPEALTKAPEKSDGVIKVDDGEAAKKEVVIAPDKPNQPLPDIGVTAKVDSNEIYGHHIFRDNQLPYFEKASDVKAPDSYIIGTGDELVVSVFGFSYFNEVLKVDAKGTINPTNIGPIRIKGIPFVKAEALIRSKFAQFFDLSNNQLTVTLAYSRVISVNFVGEVNRPGSYRIPALNTAFNALMAVGGPSELGSVRNIQIKRNGKLIKTLDVYDFLSNPNSKQEFYLEDNDYIFVSPYSKVVKISGAVKRSMRYELKPKENLNDLLNYTGGVTTSAYTKLISIKRLAGDGNQQQLLNISLDSLKERKLDFELFDGDIIVIGEKLDELTNFVEVIGPVYRPGSYEWVENSRVSDLIQKANGLKKNVRLDKAYLIRTHDDYTKEYIAISIEKILANPADTNENKILEKRDVLRLSALTDFIQEKKVSSSGLFRKTGDFDYFEGMRVSDLIFLSDGIGEEANLEKAFLIRTKPDFTKEFFSINLKDAMLPYADSTQNPFLRDKDALSVSSLKVFVDEMNINAVGLFRKPGTFRYVNGMTLSDLLVVTEGLKMEADLLNIEISRISFFADDYVMGEDSRVIIKAMQVGQDTKLTDDQLAFKLNPYDQVFVRMVPDFELPKNLTITGEVKYPGVYAITRKDEKLDEIIKRAGGLNRFAFPDGATLYRPGLAGDYLVMKLPMALKSNKSMYNYIVHDGDVINVPKVIDLIAIRGDVEFLNVVGQEQVNAPFVKGKRANYYVKDFANGFSKTSHRKKTYIQEHNGKVYRTKNLLLFKVYPRVHKGAVIYVVTKPKNEKKEKKKSEPVDWNKAIADVTIKITGLLTLMILVQTVKK